MLQQIKDKRVREKLVERIDSLTEEPEKQGKPMVADLAGYRSIRAIGQRYRIIYKVEEERIIVFILVVGIRKEGDKGDIYNLARKLVRLGLAESSEKRPRK
jgi:mRNA interferase RelE/StbE